MYSSIIVMYPSIIHVVVVSTYPYLPIQSLATITKTSNNAWQLLCIMCTLINGRCFSCCVAHYYNSYAVRLFLVVRTGLGYEFLIPTGRWFLDRL